MTGETNTEQEPKGEQPGAGTPGEERPRLASRDEVIEASRRRYATPRAEVERMIAKQMGYPTPEEQQAQLRNRLSHRLQGLGVAERQAKYLLAEYSLDRIQQQLDWLPFRGAHNPAAFIVAAIRRNFDPPERLFVDQSDNADRRGENNKPNPPEDAPTPKQEPNGE